jgi:hypothetical protein
VEMGAAVAGRAFKPDGAGGLEHAATTKASRPSTSERGRVGGIHCIGKSATGLKGRRIGRGEDRLHHGTNERQRAEQDRGGDRSRSCRSVGNKSDAVTPVKPTFRHVADALGCGLAGTRLLWRGHAQANL